jgi:hypothetical protein
VGAIVLTQSLGSYNDQIIVQGIASAAEPGTTSGFISDHSISYRLWDCSAQSEISDVTPSCYSNQQLPVTCPVFEVGGTAYVALNAKTIIRIDLRTGWNIFSANCLPFNPDMKAVMQTLIDTGCLTKVQDENGNSLEDLGLFGGWTNNIGNISATEGYKIKVTRNCQLEITGSVVALPFNIPLKAGWNIIGYPRQSTANGMAVVQPLIDRKTLIKVQDELGNSIEDLGLFGGWQNNIGNFSPGEGYKLKVSTAENLFVAASYAKSVTIVPKPQALSHFKTAVPGNGVDHMNINMVGLPVNYLHEGDEIAVFDGEICVGGMVLQQRNLAEGILSVPVSARDGYNEPGFTEGNTFTLKVWDKQNKKEYLVAPEIIQGTSTFLKHESTLISLEKYAVKGFPEEVSSKSTEVNCYPNPFKDRICIEVRTAGNSKMRVEILNQTGQLIKEIMPVKNMDNCWYFATWDGTDSNHHKVATGMYFLRIVVDNEVVVRKIDFSK